MAFGFRFGGFDPSSFGGGFGGFGDFQNADGAGGPDFTQQPKRERKPRKPIGNAFTRTLINLAVTLVFGLVYFYVELPALNPQAEELYVFVFLLCAVYAGCAIFTSGFQGTGAKGYFQFVKKQCTVPFVVVIVMIAALIVGSVTSWVVLRAKDYSQLLEWEEGDFVEEIQEISYDQIPMLDKDSAARLGSRKLGELADMVSQFEIISNYNQINYQDRPVRVTSLAYGDLIKWFTNRTEGLPAYIIIDMVTQEAEVVRLEEGMKYTTAEHFGRNLYRHLRFHYPTMMFDEPVFEIDEEGTPYWVCSRIVKTIGLFGGTDIKGAVLVNAITGESEYYEEVPTWVDRVYSYDIIMEQYDFYGMYHNGFLNSIFGQRDVTLTTEGWNYIAMDDDVYMYTGVTSVTSDQSNIGFILTNQRTKETRFYPCAGATENSAQASAQSQVQQMRYVATFPLLLNIADQPTYFMALKGDDGLVKMYAMVNVRQYQIVETGSTVAECEANYRNELRNAGLIDDGEVEIVEPTTGSVSGVIEEIRTAVINGNSQYYISLQGDDHYYVVSAADDADAVILNAGDLVEIIYDTESAGTIVEAYGVTILEFEAERAKWEVRVEDATIADIRTEVVNGETHYYVRTENGKGLLDFNAAQVPEVMERKVGDGVMYGYVCPMDAAEIEEGSMLKGTGIWPFGTKAAADATADKWIELYLEEVSA